MLIRQRTPDDVPVLARILFEQQHTSRYPFRDPLPIPVEAFLHQDDAEAAWTAEVDGRIVGHICRIGPRAGFADADAMNAACAEAHGCAVEDLAWVSTLFVATAARGLGVGRALLRTVVADIRESGSYPCLEVLPMLPSALTLYRTNGWREVLRLRPDWLTAVNGNDGPDVLVMVQPPS